MYHNGRWSSTMPSCARLPSDRTFNLAAFHHRWSDGLIRWGRGRFALPKAKPIAPENRLFDPKRIVCQPFFRGDLLVSGRVVFCVAWCTWPFFVENLREIPTLEQWDYHLGQLTCVEWSCFRGWTWKLHATVRPGDTTTSGFRGRWGTLVNILEAVGRLDW